MIGREGFMSVREGFASVLQRCCRAGIVDGVVAFSLDL